MKRPIGIFGILDRNGGTSQAGQSLDVESIGMQPRLIGLRAPVLGLTVSLAPSETTLGREAGNTVVLNSHSVSRRHARVIPQGSGFAIEDLGSANGVLVNGIPTSGAVLLKNGDRIEMGEVALLFESAEPVAAAPVTPRKSEVGSHERAFPPPSAADALPGGCNPFGSALNDLSGALPGLMKYLVPAILILLALFCLFSVLMMGVGAIQGLMHGGGSSSPPPAQGSGSGKPPPASNSSSNEQGTAKITVLSTRVVASTASQTGNMLLIKWRNDSDSAVNELDGTVIAKKSDGSEDARQNVRLYVGAPVQPGQTHEDTGQSDGVPIATGEDPAPQVIPTQVK